MHRFRQVHLPQSSATWQVALDDEGVIRDLRPVPSGTAVAGEDWQGAWLSPAGVDLQINGGLGLAFPELGDADLPVLERLLELLWRDGQEAVAPTLVTCAAGPLRQALAVLREARSRHRPGRALLLGAHLEGPFLAPERRGAHPLQHLREPDPAALAALISGFEEEIDLVTLAPERPGARELIERLRALGIVVCLGHSAAQEGEAREAFQAGVTMLTHTFNAMPGLHHRSPGPVAAALLDGRVALGLVADGVHVAPAMAVLLQRLAGDRLVIVSDALAPYGLAEGQHRWDERVLLVRDGTCRLEDGTLAGVTLPQLEGARRLARWSGDPAAAIAAATISPRRVLGDDRPVPDLLVGVPLRETLRWSWDGERRELSWRRAGPVAGAA
jgi:N-acetylglucosamine-6-phosphate deacetylase